MIKKVLLEEIKDYTKNKDGVAYVNQKTHAPFTRRTIKIVDDPTIYGGYKEKWNEGWKAGDEVNIEIFESTDPSGKKWWNFKQADMTTRMMEMINELNKRLERVEYSIKTFNEKGYHYPTEDPKQPTFVPDEPPIESYEDYGM